MFYTEMRELLDCRLYIIIICICIYFALDEIKLLWYH